MGLFNLIKLRDLLSVDPDDHLVESMTGIISECEKSLTMTKYEKASDAFFYLKDIYGEAIQVIGRSRGVREKYLAVLQEKIEDYDRALLSRDRDRFELVPDEMSVEHNRIYKPLTLDQDTEVAVKATIGKTSNWRYPGLEIGPGDGTWTRSLVACDPLYLVDIHQEFLDSTVGQFNTIYQRRLRPYLISGTDLGPLPQGQFGFIFSWNLFNYFSLDYIQQYLKSMYSVLRPGGIFVFSYNNSDIFSSALAADTGFMRHTPLRLMKPMIESIGYEMLNCFDRQIAPISAEAPGCAVSWLEIKKPGELETSKAHQVLGKIISV